MIETLTNLYVCGYYLRFWPMGSDLRMALLIHVVSEKPAQAGFFYYPCKAVRTILRPSFIFALPLKWHAKKSAP